MVRIITDGEFVKAVTAVFDKRGPLYVYNPPEGASCKYSVDGGDTGSCLFGAAIIDELGLGHGYDSDAWEGAPVTYFINGNLSIEGVVFDVGHKVREAAFQAQTSQDNGARYDEVRGEFFARAAGHRWDHVEGKIVLASQVGTEW